MFKYSILNENCEDTIKRITRAQKKVDLILTSPPYNTGRPSTSEASRNNYQGKYDIHLDILSQDDYCNWIVSLFNQFDLILKKDGVILWNVSYGTDASINKNAIGQMWLSVADIIRNTNFTVADRIIWKKKSALPNNTSKNKLTRIVEDIFVFVRKDEIKTFNMNKEVSQVGKNGQTFYKNYFNYVEAKNNDGTCNLNKATYSSDLCEQLLSLYAKEDDVIFDPFNGTGTTGVACKRLGMRYIGSEISSAQCEYSINRIENTIIE
jgi:DNA modification methylase